jgi:hypothetical protein
LLDGTARNPQSCGQRGSWKSGIGAQHRQQFRVLFVIDPPAHDNRFTPPFYTVIMTVNDPNSRIMTLYSGRSNRSFFRQDFGEMPP